MAYTQQPVNSGAFREDFNDSVLHWFRYGSTGNPTPAKWAAGVPTSGNPRDKVLSFRIDPQDSAGAGRGPEIISKGFTHFGSYAARLRVPKVADVQPNVGAVVGYFTYHMDSIAGLSEIDFEWLLADPTIIYIGTWTGADNDHLQRIGRTINLATGYIYNTEFRDGYNGASTPLTGMQNQPETLAAVKGYNASSGFYTYGFDWYPDRIRWWMLDPTTNRKVVLWDYTGSATGIPQNASEYRMNFWHTNNWSVQTNPLATEKPRQPFELQVDWMSYKPWKKGKR